MQKYDNKFDDSHKSDKGFQTAGYHSDKDRVINGESLNIDSTLEQISREMHPGETLILDIGNNYFYQADEIFDTLVLQGYDVKKTFRNGRNQIIVHKKPDFHM